MGHLNPHGLPGIQMPWETPLNGFGYTEKRCFKTNKQKNNNNKTPKQNTNYNINMQNGKAIKKKKIQAFLSPSLLGLWSWGTGMWQQSCLPDHLPS